MLLVAKLPSVNRGQLQTSCLCYLICGPDIIWIDRQISFISPWLCSGKTVSWASQTLHIQRCVLSVNPLIVYYWKHRCKTSPRYAVSPGRSRTEMPEGTFHCLRIFSLSSQAAQDSISKDLNIIMVQLITLYCVVTAGYETVLFVKQGTGTITLSQTRALRQHFTNLSFLTSDTSISPTQICNVDSLTVLQDTKILLSKITGYYALRPSVSTQYILLSIKFLVR